MSKADETEKDPAPTLPPANHPGDINRKCGTCGGKGEYWVQDGFGGYYERCSCGARYG